MHDNVAHHESTKSIIVYNCSTASTSHMINQSNRILQFNTNSNDCVNLLETEIIEDCCVLGGAWNIHFCEYFDDAVTAGLVLSLI